MVIPTDPCVDPFSQARNGGFDIITVNFTDFDTAEQFFFTTDIDPNSIQGVAGAGNAGAASGYELIDASISINFSNGAVLTASLYEDGSLGGSQAVVADGASAAPSIEAQNVGTGPAIVNDLNQTIVITGTPNAFYSLLQMDTRLFIASGDDPFDVSPAELPFYANEAMSGKQVYNGQFDASGQASVPVTILQSVGAGTSLDGGLNYFIAVTSSSPYAVDQQVSQTSNVVVLKYEEVQNTPPEISFITDVSGGISVEEGGQVSVIISVFDAETNLDTVAITGMAFVTVNDNGNGLYTAVFEPQAGDADLYTITVTATDTDAASDVETFDLEVTSGQVETSLTGTFNVQGYNQTSYSGVMTVNFYPVGSTTSVYEFTPTAANNEFTVTGIAPGDYQIAIKTATSLQVVEVVTLVEGDNTAAFGQLPSGDANDDNTVSSLDFSLLAASFNKQEGDVGYNESADFNGDGAVSSLDFSLLASNFNIGGEVQTAAP